MPNPLAVNIGRILGNFTLQRGQCNVIQTEAYLLLQPDPEAVCGPDIVVGEETSKIDDLHPKYDDVPPVLAVEILSPNDRWSRVMKKILDYLKNGVRLVWLVDPQNREVMVYRPGHDPYTVETNQEVTGQEILPGFRCPVSEFFRMPGEPAPGSNPA